MNLYSRLSDLPTMSLSEPVSPECFCRLTCVMVDILGCKLELGYDGQTGKKISFGSHIMLSSASAFGVSAAGGFGFSGSMGSTRGFAAMNVVKVRLD